MTLGVYAWTGLVILLIGGHVIGTYRNGSGSGPLLY